MSRRPVKVKWKSVHPGGARWPISVLRDPGLTASARYLIVGIYLEMDAHGRDVSHATNDELADFLGRSPRTVARGVAQLVDRGHLVVETVRTDSGPVRGLRPILRALPLMRIAP